eukprot:13158651-Alexandrium_andersonii.AAC.1
MASQGPAALNSDKHPGSKSSQFEALERTVRTYSEAETDGPQTQLAASGKPTLARTSHIKNTPEPIAGG